MIKLDFKLPKYDGTDHRDWCVPDKGTGHKDSEQGGIFCGNEGGVKMPVPVRFQFDADGAGKPEVHRKGRAT